MPRNIRAVLVLTIAGIAVALLWSAKAPDSVTFSAQTQTAHCPVDIPDQVVKLTLTVAENDSDTVETLKEIPALTQDCLSAAGEVVIVVDYQLEITTNMRGAPHGQLAVGLFNETVTLEFNARNPIQPTSGAVRRARPLENLTSRTLPVDIALSCTTTQPDPGGQHGSCAIDATVVIKREIIVGASLPEAPNAGGGPSNPIPDSPAISFVSPKCVAPGKIVHIHGFRFRELGPPLRVLVDGVEAKVLDALPFVIHARVPKEVTGRVEVTVEGISEGKLLDVNANCHHRPLDSDDLTHGFLVGEIVIFLTETLDEQALEAFKQEFGFELLVEFPTVNMARGILEVKGPEATHAALDLLNQDSRVQEAFLNHVLRPHQTDPQLPSQLWLETLGLPAGWDTFFPNRGNGITIAVIDTGADFNIPLEGSPELTFDPDAPSGLDYSPETDGSDSAQDELGHGTIVSTIAAGTVNDFNGVGVAPAANILPIKVFALSNGEIVSSNNAVAQALESAFAREVDVINLSLGCHGCSAEHEAQLRSYYGHLLDRLFEDQAANGRQAPIIVASAGNDAEPIVDSPAAYAAVIAVGSLQSDGVTPSEFSNYGEELDFLTEGESIWTTLSNGDFGDPGSGTSYAAPQLAGLVALILGEDAGLSVDEVMGKIIDCFVIDLDAPGFDPNTGWGKVSIPAASDAPAGCLP